MMHSSQAVGAQNYSQWGLEQLAAFVVVVGECLCSKECRAGLLAAFLRG